MTTETLEKPKVATDGYDITVEQASKILGVTERSVTRYIKKGKLSAIQSFNEQGLKRYLLSQQQVKAYKDNLDRSVQPLSSPKSDSQTPQSTGSKDSQEDGQSTGMASVIGIITKQHDREINRLEGYIKERDDTIKEQEGSIKKLAFQMGELSREVRMLKGDTDSTTDRPDWSEDVETGPSDQPKDSESDESDKSESDKPIEQKINTAQNASEQAKSDTSKSGDSESKDAVKKAMPYVWAAVAVIVGLAIYYWLTSTGQL